MTSPAHLAFPVMLSEVLLSYCHVVDSQQVPGEGCQGKRSKFWWYTQAGVVQDINHMMKQGAMGGVEQSQLLASQRRSFLAGRFLSMSGALLCREGVAQVTDGPHWLLTQLSNAFATASTYWGSAFLL